MEMGAELILDHRHPRRWISERRLSKEGPGLQLLQQLCGHISCLLHRRLRLELVVGDPAGHTLAEALPLLGCARCGPQAFRPRLAERHLVPKVQVAPLGA